MPVQYTNVIDEHKATRNAAGLFDICHMGEIEVKGPQALDLLQLVLTRNLADQTIGQVKLSALLNEEGGIIDDLTVYKLDENSIHAGYQRHPQRSRLAMDKINSTEKILIVPWKI